ncbi:ABC transporter substrate-binding protein [Streptomyces sp. OF3]|uniref:ABC transporter substrate-binding protein n=1 Tax=Streptomyces alkaliterrae TaxID=2213162 RepID=A0A7W3WPB2_9ACTN|nr:ABC transporter substrate-binding protein [Streptomyces alkaliterrae]MBB1256039.1 ABC transporter substrate-binding protein [Streptomyces alkaliterrae]
MPPATLTLPSRRAVLSTTGALGLGALLTACGGERRDGGGAGGGRWSFTDDRGREAKADHRPERVVAFTGAAATLHDLGVDRRLVGVFGETKQANGQADPGAGDLDVDSVEIVGNAWGEFNVEKYAGLRPDLLVTHMFDKGALWYVPDESREKILRVAPSVAITTGRVPITEPIERYAELAGALGADLKAEKVTRAKARFEKAAENLRRTARGSGIRVMAASGAPDTFYVSSPKVNSDLIYFRQLGVDLVQPDDVEQGGYFESLSWENADKYQADLIILDNRTASLQPNDLKSKPGWRNLPAVHAGQVVEWDAVPRFSWAGFAPTLEALSRAIGDAKKVA